MFISKRVLIIIGVVLVVLAGAISFTLAYAFSHTNQVSTVTDTPTALPSVTSNKTGNGACIQGVIQSLGNQSFLVAENKGKRTVTVNVNNQTTYDRHGGQASLSFTDLVVGDKVRVSVEGQCNKQETTVVAQGVIVLTATGSPNSTPVVSPTP